MALERGALYLAATCTSSYRVEKDMPEFPSLGFNIMVIKNDCTFASFLLSCFSTYTLWLYAVVHRLLLKNKNDADKPARRVWKSVKVTKNSTIPCVRHSFLLCNSNFVFRTRRFSDIRLQKMS